MFKKFMSLGSLVFVLIFAATSVMAADYGFQGNIASGDQYDLYTIPLIAGENVTVTLVCDPNNPTLDTIISVYFPGSDPSDNFFSDVYNDDGGEFDCGGFSSSIASFSAPVAGDYIFRVDGFGSSTGDYSMSIRTGGEFNPVADGRINPHAHAPIVLYCRETSVDVFSVDGELLGNVANGGSGTFGSAVIAPTSSGRMELNATMRDGKTYLFIWDGCARGNSETYTIENGVAVLFATASY